MSLRHRLIGFVPHGLALFMAAVFLDSLRYKFTDHPKTQVIFGRLDGWTSQLGLPGLFAHTGLFSQYVIGSIELLASSLLVIGILPRLRHLQAAGACQRRHACMASIMYCTRCCPCHSSRLSR